jgi:7-cyano-7-deazaguanine synthase
MNQSYRTEEAVVLASGGQDSTTCLVWALKNFAKVRAVGFFYQQKHSVELDAARRICALLGVEFKVVDLSFLKDLVVSNLFQGTGDVAGKHVQNQDVPSSFVPYRNLLFLTLASAWAGTVGAKHIVTGVCETDFSGYADCRDVFVKSAQATLNLATDFRDRNIVIHTPLMWLTKAEEFRMAEELGCLDLILKETMTCYQGSPTVHPFGQGCGECPSCLLRKKGYEEYLGLYHSERASPSY